MMFYASSSLNTAAPTNPQRGPIFHPDGTQSLSAWEIVQADDDVWVQHKTDEPLLRLRSPDGHNKVEGIPHPPFITQQSWNESRACFKPKEGDVWVATYPKCGTTFMEQIILLLQHNGDASKTSPATQNNYSAERGAGKVWVEQRVRLNPDPKRNQMSFEELGALPAPRVLKTHAPWNLFLAREPCSSTSLMHQPGPILPETKVVYVSRAAKDACVSAYYHAANPHRQGWPFDAWVKDWAGGLFEHGTWFAHVAGWRAQWAANPKQLLWVRYEDLKADPEKEVRRVAAFLEIELSEELLAKVIEHSGFAAMKKKAQGSRMENFYRQGKVGDSNNHFVDPQLIAEFDELNAGSMQGVNGPY